MLIIELKYAIGKEIKVSNLCHICGVRWRLVVNFTLGPLLLYPKMLFLFQ
jgi:hypothetical protein